jgi:hypothetical protein
MPILTIKHGTTEIDEDDYEWVSSHRWHLGDTGYVLGYSEEKGKTPAHLHRLIMQRIMGRPLRAGEYIDHMNGDKVDNRRSNLRLVTKSQNGMNLRRGKGLTSKYIGVHCDRSRPYKKWMAYITIDQKRWQIGRYASEEEAAWMRDQWALALHGEFAGLNFEYLPV